MPERYPTVVRQDPTMEDPGFVEVDGYRLRPNVDLIPQRGMQENLCASDCNLIFLTGSATGGKEEPYDAKIITPNGEVTMGSLHIGDIISSVDGGTQVVQQIYEQGIKDVYELEFEDESVVQCGTNHLWNVSFDKKPNFKTIIFNDIKDCFESGKDIYIPTCQPVVFNDNNNDYRLASIKERRRAIGRVILWNWTTENKEEAEDVAWVARSLGYNCKILFDKKEYSFEIDNESYKKLKSIRYVGKKQCRCILVSSPDHLYLTDNFIVTHNTFGGLLASMKGLGHQNYTGRIITMQSKDGGAGTSMSRDAEQIYGRFANCRISKSEGITAEWPQWNNAIKFIHVNFNPDNPNEWEQFKQVAKANTAIFMYIDEGTGIETWKKFAYLFSRNRDSSGAMNPHMVMSFNPEHAHFTTAFLKRAGYLTDEWWFDQNMNGKIRYFYSTGDDVDGLVFGRTREEVVRLANITVTPAEAAFGLKPEDMVKSFTCFFASPVDNKILVNITKGESIANIAAVGKTEGAKMQFGYFGPSAEGTTKVTPQVIENIFKSPVSSFEDERYATLDVSAGGDLTIMWIWRGLTIIGREDIVSNDPVRIEEWVSHNLAKWNVSVRNFAFDSGGMGFFLKRFKDGYAITNNMRPVQEIDSFGNPTDIHKDYYDIRSQLMAKFEAMLIMGDVSCEISPQAMFPHTRKKVLKPFRDILMEERNLFLWETVNDKKKARTKDTFKTRFGYSPDCMDALWLVARFYIDSRPKKEEQRTFTAADYYTAFNI